MRFNLGLLTAAVGLALQTWGFAAAAGWASWFLPVYFGLPHSLPGFTVFVLGLAAAWLNRPGSEGFGLNEMKELKGLLLEIPKSPSLVRVQSLIRNQIEAMTPASKTPVTLSPFADMGATEPTWAQLSSAPLADEAAAGQEAVLAEIAESAVTVSAGVATPISAAESSRVQAAIAKTAVPKTTETSPPGGSSADKTAPSVADAPESEPTGLGQERAEWEDAIAWLETYERHEHLRKLRQSA